MRNRRFRLPGRAKGSINASSGRLTHRLHALLRRLARYHWGWAVFALACLCALALLTYSSVAALAAILAGIPVGLLANEIFRRRLPPEPGSRRAVPSSADLLDAYHAEYSQRWEILPLDVSLNGLLVQENATLSALYVALGTNSPPASAGALRPLWPDAADSQSSALEAVLDAKRAALIGDAGSGKSSFLKYLGLAAFSRSLPAQFTGCTPIIASMSRIASGLNEHPEPVEAFWAAIAADLPEGLDDLLPILRDRASRGKVLLLLDGLDEVDDGMLPQSAGCVQALIAHYAHIPLCVVTSRTRSFAPGVLPAVFAPITLAPFTQTSIESFARAWYAIPVASGRLSVDEGRTAALELARAALAPSLRPLAENPLLLTAIASIHQRDESLPQERVRIYARCCAILMERWRLKRLSVPPALLPLFDNQHTLLTILQRIAFAAMQGTNTNLQRGELLVLLEDPSLIGSLTDANLFLDFVDRRAGLLVGQGGGATGRPQAYGFPHGTFQEYLAGCHVLEQRSEVRLIKSLLDESGGWQLPITLGTEDLYYNRRSTTRLMDLLYSLAIDVDKDGVEPYLVVLSGQIAAMVGEDAIISDHPSGGGAQVLSRLVRGLDKVSTLSTAPASVRVEAASAMGRLRASNEVRRGAVDIELVNVAAGSFDMGSDRREGCLGFEGPRHKCLLPAFQISRFPIARAQFSEFVGDDGYSDGRFWSEAERAGIWLGGCVSGERDMVPRSAPHTPCPEVDLPNAPILGVTWYESLAFCRWLTTKMRQAGRLGHGQVVALPSEAQYEKAAGNNLFPWGDAPDGDLANYLDTGLGKVVPIGCFPRGRSSMGAEELSGNTWEWTRTLWMIRHGRQQFRYPYVTDDGREALSAGPGVARVLRGAACYNAAIHMRRSIRDCGPPGKWSDFVSFRIVVEDAQ